MMRKIKCGLLLHMHVVCLCLIPLDICGLVWAEGPRVCVDGRLGG